MLFLEELHNLPAIGETLSTCFKGGIKSRVYKDSRLENVKSILSLNFAVSEFIARFSGELPDVTNWPRIQLSTRGETIHPLVMDPEVVKKIFDSEELQLPENQLTLDRILFTFSCNNSDLGRRYLPQTCTYNIVKRGDTNIFCRELPQAMANRGGYKQELKAFTFDRYDNVFYIILFKDKASNEYVYVLFVYDSCRNKQHERVLNFPNSDTLVNLHCVVDNDIFIQADCAELIYIFDSSGNLKCRLSLEQNPSHRSGDFISLECVTNDDGIVMRTHQNVFVYTKEGKLKRTLKVKNDISEVTYNYVTSKIEILMEKQSMLGTMSYYILSYSAESDEVECLYLPVNTSVHYPLIGFYRHPTGSTVLRDHFSQAATSIAMLP